MATDLSLQRTFRKNVEERLTTAAERNADLIVSWELSKSYDRVALVCGEERFSDRAIVHLATSLVRLLGVGKRMGLVDRDLNVLTVECFPQQGTDAIFARAYGVE